MRGFQENLPAAPGSGALKSPAVELAMRHAASQHGAFRRADLLAEGTPAKTIESQVARKVFLPIYAGVYAIGHGHLPNAGRWMAAVLAGGPGACLSHRSAAQLHGIDESRLRSDEPIHLIRPHGGGGAAKRAAHPDQPHVYLHRISLPTSDRTRRKGIPVTTVERTLIDLATCMTARRLEGAVLNAYRRHLFDPRRLFLRLSTSGQGRKGIGALREIVADLEPAMARTFSDPEAWILRLLRRHDLPKPAVNERVEGLLVDFVWRKQRLVVEFDGDRYHSGREARRRDKARDRRLGLAGYTVLRYAYEDLVHSPNDMAREIVSALRSRPHEGSPDPPEI